LFEEVTPNNDGLKEDQDEDFGSYWVSRILDDKLMLPIIPVVPLASIPQTIALLSLVQERIIVWSNGH
jgi:hypothetical protein